MKIILTIFWVRSEAEEFEEWSSWTMRLMRNYKKNVQFRSKCWELRKHSQRCLVAVFALTSFNLRHELVRLTVWRASKLPAGAGAVFTRLTVAPLAIAPILSVSLVLLITARVVVAATRILLTISSALLAIVSTVTTAATAAAAASWLTESFLNGLNSILNVIVRSANLSSSVSVLKRKHFPLLYFGQSAKLVPTHRVVFLRDGNVHVVLILQLLDGGSTWANQFAHQAWFDQYGSHFLPKFPEMTNEKNFFRVKICFSNFDSVFTIFQWNSYLLNAHLPYLSIYDDYKIDKCGLRIFSQIFTFTKRLVSRFECVLVSQGWVNNFTSEIARNEIFFIYRENFTDVSY